MVKLLTKLSYCLIVVVARKHRSDSNENVILNLIQDQIDSGFRQNDGCA